MFLLFQFLRYHHGFCFQDLHSNMFLLFPFYPLGTHSFQKLIYIPICFYYFLLSTSGVCQFLAHLHSNMFLLFPLLPEWMWTCTPIYIPICFYYFDGVDMDIRETQIHLHSNMFLLFQIQVLGE